MSTKSNLRLNVVNQIKSSLILNNESCECSIQSIDSISNKIEEFIYNNSNKDESAKIYRDKSRDIVNKIKKRENIERKKSLITGKITIEEFINDKGKDNTSNVKIYKKEINNKNITRKIMVPPKIKIHHSRNNSENKEDNNNKEIKIEPPPIIQKEIIQDRKERTIKEDIKISNEILLSKDAKIKSSNDEINFILSTDKDNTLINSIHKEKVMKKAIEQVKEEHHKIKENGLTLLQESSVPRTMIKSNSFSNIKTEKKKRTEQLEYNHKLLELELKQRESEAQCLLYKKEIDSLRNELNSIKEKNIELNTKNKTLEIDMNIMKNTIKNQSLEIERLTKMNDKYNSNYIALQTKVEKKNESLESKMEKFMNDLDKLNNKFSKSSLNSISIEKIEKLNINEVSQPKKDIPKQVKNLFDSTDTGISFSKFINSNC